MPTAYSAVDIPASTPSRTRRAIRWKKLTHRATELQQAGTFELAEIVLRWDQGRLHELSGLVPTNPLVSAWTSAVAGAAAGRAGADEALRAEVARNEPDVWTSHGRLALLAHAVADRGLVDLVQPLLDRMAPLEPYLATLGQIGTVGPMALAMARLADLAGDHATARTYLATAPASPSAPAGRQRCCTAGCTPPRGRFAPMDRR